MGRNFRIRRNLVNGNQLDLPGRGPLAQPPDNLDIDCQTAVGTYKKNEPARSCNFVRVKKGLIKRIKPRVSCKINKNQIRKCQAPWVSWELFLWKKK